MIADFESRLASVLGGRLAAPLNGRVSVAPGPAPGDDDLRVLLGVTASEPAPAELGRTRPERVPGADDPRRVLRLRCTIELQVEPAGRVAQQAAVDALLYLLDAPDFRDGTALGGEGDLGFLIQQMRLTSAGTPLAPGAEQPVRVALVADGWFWPVGVAGEAGGPIREARIRGHVPVEVDVEGEAPVVGGPVVVLRVTTKHRLRLRIGEGGVLSPRAYGRLSVSLEDPDGGPGAGTLRGGAAGSEGNRLYNLDEDGVATVRYQPPGREVNDVLVVALEDAEEGASVVLVRHPLPVRAP